MFLSVLLLIAALLGGLLLPIAISSGHAGIWLLTYATIISLLLRLNVRCRPALCAFALPILVAAPFAAAYFGPSNFILPSPAADGSDARLHLYDVIFPQLLGIAQQADWDFANRLMAVLAATSTALLPLVAAIAGPQLIGVINEKLATPTSTSFIWYSDTLPTFIGATLILGHAAMLGMVTGFVAPNARGALDQIVQTPQPATTIIIVVAIWTTSAILMAAVGVWGLSRSSNSFFNSAR